MKGIAKMRTYRLVVWGRELFAWEIDGALEVVVTTESDTVVTTTEEDSEDDEIAGAGSHNFERDLNPCFPETQKDCDSWLDRPFGFQRGE